MPEDIGELKPGESHPGAEVARMYIMESPTELADLLDAFIACSREGNRMAAICARTLAKLMSGEFVEDRYLMGLAWEVYSLDKMQEITTRTKEELLRERARFQ